ncbi:MAG: tripartite tricarboxylate transporter substrate binding protein [Betaproteobacteria bacterium]|nr:tripartite tricarboxylate transporter substrate binding protein [Betaproteobacteria bacterium]
MRALLAVPLLAVPLLFAAATGLAAYPERPLRMIVPQAVGASTDNVARIVATELARELGQNVIVDNRPGGALQLGMELTARAPADGYTIGYAPIGSLAIGPHLVAKPPIDALRELAPVGQTITGHMMLLAGPKTPFKTVREIIDFAEQNPGKLFNASSSNGSPGHIGFELLKTMTGIQITHVPYKGGPAAISDLMSGQVQLMMEGLNSASGHVRAGRVRGIAVTGAKRSPVFPEVPTLIESGVAGYEATTWHGMVVPAGTPRGVVALLNERLNRAVLSPSASEKIFALGSELLVGTPEAFWALVRSESAKWAEVIRRAGARID